MPSNRIVLDDGTTMVPVPSAPVVPVAPPPPIVPPTPEVIAAADAAGLAAAAGANALLAGGGSAEIAAAEQAAGATPTVVQALIDAAIPRASDVIVTSGNTPDVPPAPGDPAYPPEDAADWPDTEEGDADFTDEKLLALEDEADALDAGEPILLAVTHPAPGTIIGKPYEGTHSKAFNIAGGSDNWQSENAVDIWLFPGTHILAVEDGTISPGGWGYGRSATSGRFAGWRLHLVGSGGRVFYYTHMAALTVLKGTHVKRGDVIGHSGIANGVPHLHFAVNPPFAPAVWAKATYDLHARTAIGASPVTGGPPGDAGGYVPAGVNAQWSQLMGFFASGVPKRHDAVQSFAASLKGVFT